MMKRSEKRRLAATQKAKGDDANTPDAGGEILESGVPVAAVADGVNEPVVEAETDEAAPTVDAEDTVESLREKLATAEDALLRAKAEFLNAQRRQEKSRLEAVRYANADLMRALLGVLDDFDRSLDAAHNAAGTEAVVEGVRLVYENFKKALRDQGLEEIDAVDQTFDPHIHEALLMQPVADKSPNTVIEQIAKGFRLHDRVLRPAKVIVSKTVESDIDNVGIAPGENSGPDVDEYA